MSNGLGISDGILRTEDISWWGWGGEAGCQLKYITI